MADIDNVMSTLERQRQALVDEYVRRAWKMWQSLTPQDWWNDAVTQGVAAQITQTQMAFVRQMRRLGISYANIMLGMVLDGESAYSQIPEYIVVRDNTDPWKVSVRPADEYRRLAVRDPSIRPKAWEGLDDAVENVVNDWLDAARNRLADNAETDGSLALARATVEQYRNNGVTRYRRVIHPELSKSGTCGLCIVAANNVYSTAALMPMHDRCKCGVAPIVGDDDPGLRLNQDDLERIYRAAYEAASDERRQWLNDRGFDYSTFAKDLANLRVTVTNHSELGPILTRETAGEKSVPDYDAPEWHTPDREMTSEQMRRMYDRATYFDTMYRQVHDTGEPVTFRYGGRTYTFKPGAHFNQAWEYQRSLLRSLAASLGLAA